jgi:hypothetical protein
LTFIANKWDECHLLISTNVSIIIWGAVLGWESMTAPFSLEPILRRYGDRRPSIQAAYRTMFDAAHRLVEPRSAQKTFLATELPAFAAYLPGAETITLGICTIGPKLEARVTELFNEDDPVSAVILDEIGTLWVNGLGRELHEKIRTAAKAASKRASPSYRPGIGRWPVELQRTLLDHLPAAAGLGVHLVEGMMIPQKSVSMIVGVGTKLGKPIQTPGGNL